MNTNRVKKALKGLYTIQYQDKYRICTYENKYITFNKVRVKSDRAITRFNENHWKQMNKFIKSVHDYDKYYDSELTITKDLITFKTDYDYEYNVKFDIRLGNFNNIFTYGISHKDIAVINNIIKEFGKVKSVTIYKYPKTIVKLLFNKYEIYLVI